MSQDFFRVIRYLDSLRYESNEVSLKATYQASEVATEIVKTAKELELLMPEVNTLVDYGISLVWRSDNKTDFRGVLYSLDVDKYGNFSSYISPYARSGKVNNNEVHMHLLEFYELLYVLEKKNLHVDKIVSTV